MSQEQKPFSINDRRHFTADGQPRGEPSEDQSPQGPRPREGSPREPVVSPPAATPAADLGAFILSLGAQAGLLLSEGASESDLAARLPEVRHIISILEMLKDKTEGRRTPREDQVIEGVLYELRMGYLARARVGGA